jgi:hypothetical protein
MELKPYNIMLTSGTLSPLCAWQSELDLPFQSVLSNLHIIKPEQLLVTCVRKGGLKNQ